ncbi:hypothetical protein L345_16946, partial [Ophiophagus hannah]
MRYLPMARLSKKLNPRYLGPFPVEAVIKPVAFCVSLPSLLVPVSANSPHRPAPPSPGPVAPHGVVEVDCIWDSHWLQGQFQYLMAWKGYGPEDFTWDKAAD